MSVSNAFPFYITIIFVSVILMALSQKWACGRLIKFRKFFFLVSFIPLWYVSAFTSSGADYEQYAFICYDAAFRIQDSFTEVGWNALSLILTFIFNDPYKTLFVIQTITLLLYMYAFYLMRKEVSLWLSLLAFEIFLFFNFGLMSIYLSIAFLMLSVIQYVKNNKKYAIVLLLIASTFHSSALFWVPAYIIVLLANRFNLSLRQISIILGVAIILFVSMIGVLIPILTNLPIFQQYSTYDFEGGLSFGLGNLVLYIVYFYVLNDFLKDKTKLEEKRMLLVLILVFFAYMLIGYMIPTVTRMKFYSVLITAFFIPKALKLNYNRSKSFLWILFVILFGGLGLYKTIMTEEYLMSNWIFFNPW